MHDFKSGTSVAVKVRVNFRPAATSSQSLHAAWLAAWPETATGHTTSPWVSSENDRGPEEGASTGETGYY